MNSTRRTFRCTQEYRRRGESLTRCCAKWDGHRGKCGPRNLRDDFRDPWGWLLDSIPWPLRRVVLARRMHLKPSEIPHSARYIGMRRPPLAAFELGRKLAKEHGW